MFSFQVKEWNKNHNFNLLKHIVLTEKENTSTMSRATRHAVSFIEERSGMAADKQEPARDPTILLYLLISFSLQSKSSQYSKVIK